MFCDLHTHSTASDGTVPPAALAPLAKAAGLAAIALTDHDTTDGLPACEAACAAAGIAFVPGIEISSDPSSLRPHGQAFPPRGTLHLLGLFVRHDDAPLAQIQRRMKAARDSRNHEIIEKLNQLGIAITDEQVVALAHRDGSKAIGRPHIGQVLASHGFAKDVPDAFAKYLRRGAAAYVRRDRLPAGDAIGAVHHAGGLAVLAHPVQLGCRGPDELETAVEDLKGLELDAIETRHSDHSAAEVEQFERLAKKFGLLVSGGSDFHGTRKPVDLGSQAVPIAVFEQLRLLWCAR